MLEKLKQTIQSTRFWAIVGIAIIGYLKGVGFMEGSAADSLMIILGGYAAIRTSENFQ